jgi:type IV secretory pathway TraG/TraD family ATPase VirD4
MDVHPDQYFRPTVFLCDEYQNFATVGANDPNGDERFLSLSRQPKCIPIVATQSVNSIREALPGSGYKTLLQAFRTKVFLATSDPDTARYGSELCGKTEKTRINYSLSENSNDAHIGMLSGKASANRATVSASKTYQKQKEALFEDKAFYQLKNAQSITVAYDGINPLPPTYCFLKPDFMSKHMTWFEQEAAGFDPHRVA